MNEDKSYYYDLGRTLTHNCLFNFIIGNRGGGKTYAFKKWAIKDFIKNGNQFIYVRRYETEIKEVTKDNKFFADIIANNEFPNVKLSIKGKTAYIDGKIAGYFIELSKAKIKKSTSYPYVTKIGFDEFIIEKSVYRYLDNEVDSFNDLYETVARPGTGHPDVICFFLSNAVTISNPYFLYWELQPPKPPKKVFKKDGDILVEMVANETFINKKKETRFGKLISGTRYSDYAIENKFYLDDSSFVEKKSDTSSYYITLKYKGEFYGVWIDYGVGKMWVSDKVDPCCKLVYSMTLQDHSPNTLLIKQLSRAIFIKNFIENFKLGNVYFESIKIKNITYEIIKMCINK